MTEATTQPILQKLDMIEQKVNSTLELQLRILEKFLREEEPLKDEVEAIESEEELITEEELRGVMVM